MISISLNSRILLGSRGTLLGLQRIASQSGRLMPLRPTTNSSIFPITIPVGVLKAPRAVGAWLMVCGLMCGSAVVLGGATRLTESGLSMVHWRFLGEKRPRTYVEWVEEFERYKAFPEFALYGVLFSSQNNRVFNMKKAFHVKSFSYSKSLQDGEMSLAEFKRIYWLEYIHRQWGRAIGLVYLLPAAGFALAGCFARPMRIRVLTLGALLGFEVCLSSYSLTCAIICIRYGYVLFEYLKLNESLPCLSCIHNTRGNRKHDAPLDLMLCLLAGVPGPARLVHGAERPQEASHGARSRGRQVAARQPDTRDGSGSLGPSAARLLLPARRSPLHRLPALRRLLLDRLLAALQTS